MEATMPRRLARRVAHKSTGGILLSLPEPVDPVGNAPDRLTPNTVAHLTSWPSYFLTFAFLARATDP